MFVDTLVNIFYVNFFLFAHWFMSIMIYHIQSHSISVDQDRYATYVVAEYLDIATVNTSTTFVIPLFHLI